MRSPHRHHRPTLHLSLLITALAATSLAPHAYAQDEPAPAAAPATPLMTKEEASAERAWTSNDGTTITATFKGLEGDVATLLMNNTSYPVPLERLSPADQDWARAAQLALTMQDEPPAPSPTPTPTPAPGTPAPDTPVKLGETILLKGGTTTVTLPVPEDLQAIARRGGGDRADFAEIAFAIAEGFSPAPNTPVLIANGAISTDRTKNNRAGLAEVWQAATAKGWVAFSADSVDAPKKAPVDPEFRWAMLKTALLAMEESWPGAKEWPLAFVGEGKEAAEAAGMLAAAAAKDGYKVVGMIFGKATADDATAGFRKFRPDEESFFKTPIYLADGLPRLTGNQTREEREERTLVREMERRIEGIVKTAERTGFELIQSKTVNSWRHIPENLLGEALDWFLDPKPVPPAVPAD
jgi:hypothetical protein